LHIIDFQFVRLICLNIRKITVSPLKMAEAPAGRNGKEVKKLYPIFVGIFFSFIEATPAMGRGMTENFFDLINIK
jgi:hypothetical protein